MSGVAEGIAGLALSAISVAALFTTCIECFDIVVAGKNFSEDYEQLCALVSGLLSFVQGLCRLCAVLFAAGSVWIMGRIGGFGTQPGWPSSAI
jgi:hypothetical protein